MTKLLITFFLLFSLQSFAQKGQCACDKDSTLESPGIGCDTTMLSDHSKLYWQYNCEGAWLTLENSEGKKIILDNISAELYDQAIGMGLDFIKEFEKSILFRGNCTSNEACLYTLLAKQTGKEIKLFNQLICIDSENTKYHYDFVVYLSDTSKHIIIHYINGDSVLRVPFNETLSDFVPEFQFESMLLEENILTLTYESDAHEKKKLIINLSDKRYRR